MGDWYQVYESDFIGFKGMYDQLKATYDAEYAKYEAAMAVYDTLNNEYSTYRSLYRQWATDKAEYEAEIDYSAGKLVN